MSVTKNIITGESVSEGPDGFRATVVYHLTGVTGNPEQRVASALFTAGIPQPGDPYPGIAGLRVHSRTATPITDSTTTAVKVVVQYEQLKVDQQPADSTQLPQISVGGSLNQVTTQKDVFGNQITVSHTFDQADADGNITTTTKTQGGEVEVQVPATVFQYVRREPISPGILSLEYVGKINGSFFAGADAGKWLCTRIEGQSDDGGQTYTVTYEFQKNDDGWDATVLYIDPDTGRPPIGLVEGEGIKTVQVYRMADFGQLNLGA